MAALKALIPLDGSDFSRQVLPHVCRLLDPKVFTLVLLRVAPPPSGLHAIPPRPLILDGGLALSELSAQERELERHPIYASQTWENFRTELLDTMQPDLACLTERGFSVSLAVHFGDAGEEIAALVNHDGFDLVVMATRGRSGLGRALLGSVAERVLRSVEVPVMMVRSRAAPRGLEV